MCQLIAIISAMSHRAAALGLVVSSTLGGAHPTKGNLRGNATVIPASDAGATRRLGGIPFQCTAGPDAVADCSGMGGSCTPYPFMPDTTVAQEEPSWQDSTPYNTYAFVPYNEDSYQAYKADDPATDVWVVHAHDRAGAQAADCGGDVHYFEHFEEPGNPNGRKCDYAAYPAQDNWCYFDHPGTGQTFGQYQCGWWRGYDNALDASLWKAWDNIGADAQGAKSVKDTAMMWLRNCDNCPKGDGTMHTFADVGSPVAWFTGVLFPWVCSWTDGDTSTIPWTGEKGKKCYCDNEPWGGRNGGSDIPNHFMQVIYCAKYQNEAGMHCDMITFTCDSGSCSGSSITAQNFWLPEGSF